MPGAGSVIASVLVAYAVGGIPIGVLVAQAQGVDIRRQGSGNIGASNVLRTLGTKAGIIVWLADVVKGLLPVVGARLALGGSEPLLSLVGLSAVVGHCFSPYLKLQGGRGVSTSLGVLLALDWRVGLSAFAVWLLVVVGTRYISLASILAAVSGPILFALYADSRYYLALGVGVALLLIERHRPNIRRLLAGTETKLGQKAGSMPGEANDGT